MLIVKEIYPEFKMNCEYRSLTFIKSNVWHEYCANGLRKYGDGCAKEEKDCPRIAETGKWIKHIDIYDKKFYVCEKCKWQSKFQTFFCPNCGSKMEV
jgi:predicted RNA-binding Zn-ribbon protein involved in translation (DUF1610 family)